MALCQQLFLKKWHIVSSHVPLDWCSEQSVEGIYGLADVEVSRCFASVDKHSGLLILAIKNQDVVSVSQVLGSGSNQAAGHEVPEVSHFLACFSHVVVAVCGDSAQDFAVHLLFYHAQYFNQCIWSIELTDIHLVISSTDEEIIGSEANHIEVADELVAFVVGDEAESFSCQAVDPIHGDGEGVVVAEHQAVPFVLFVQLSFVIAQLPLVKEALIEKFVVNHVQLVTSEVFVEESVDGLGHRSIGMKLSVASFASVNTRSLFPTGF